jgi:hypothetical protein
MKSPFNWPGFVIAVGAFCLPSQVRAQTDDIEISGVTVSTNATEVMLIQKSTGAGRWVKIGQSFAGYTAKSYDDKTGQLTLIHGEVTRILTLKKSTVAAASATPATPEQQKALTNNLRQLAAAADQYFLEQGVNTVTVGQLIGTEPTKYIKELKPAAGETYPGNMVIEQGKPIKIKTAGGFEMSYQN